MTKDKITQSCWLAKPLPNKACTCGKHFAKRGFEFSLLPSRIHARLVVATAGRVETHTRVSREEHTGQAAHRWALVSDNHLAILYNTKMILVQN
jgi:hypothetical protein